MCTDPVTLPSGMQVSCRECKQCRASYVSDWVGRCIAESKTAAHTHVVTLTYGLDDHYQVDHMRAKMLTYSDVVQYLKRLRAYTKGLRYFCTGEYGSRKGRAHWHLIIFWQGDPIEDIRLRERYLHEGSNGRKLWDRGFSFWDEADYHSVDYAVKYILKGEDWQPYRMACSVKPPLGFEYFKVLARRYVEQGLSPQNNYYYFADVRQKDGTLREFYLRGVSREYFCEAFRQQWELKYQNRDWPQSELMDEYIDEWTRRCKRAAGIADFEEQEFLARESLHKLEKKWITPTESVASVVLRNKPLNQYSVAGRRQAG